MSLRRLTVIVAAALLAAGLGFFAVLRWSPGSGGLAADTAAAIGGDAAAAGHGADAASPDVRRQPVTIYQRADAPAFALVGVEAEIVWLDSPVDRARQVVQLVLEGVPGGSGGSGGSSASGASGASGGSGTPGAIPPAPVGVRYRDVRLATNGVAWIDFEGATLGGLGSDHEEALVGALARSLTQAFPDEIRRVGVLVDGMPARSLAGHLDTTRTYTGREFPVSGGAGGGSDDGDGGGGDGGEGDAATGGDGDASVPPAADGAPEPAPAEPTVAAPGAGANPA